MPKPKLGRPPTIPRPPEVKPISIDLWLAVKRIEQAAATLPEFTKALAIEVEKLRKQMTQANKVITMLIREREDTQAIDYDTLNQHTSKLR